MVAKPARKGMKQALTRSESEIGDGVIWRRIDSNGSDSSRTRDSSERRHPFTNSDTLMKIFLLIPILFLAGCSLRGLVTTAGEVETITRGSSYIKTGVAVYDHIRPTK